MVSSSYFSSLPHFRKSHTGWLWANRMLANVTQNEAGWDLGKLVLLTCASDINTRRASPEYLLPLQPGPRINTNGADMGSTLQKSQLQLHPQLKLEPPRFSHPRSVPSQATHVLSHSVVSNSVRPHELYSPPDSSVLRIVQARILAWVSSSRGSS